MNMSHQELIQAARQKLEQGHYSVEQRELILYTLDLLLELARSNEKAGENSSVPDSLFSDITSHQNLVAIIKQQADELDALKRITFNLTSSLQMPVILGAIVTEAMRLIKNAHDAHIFLYQDGKLTFGASLDSDGIRNQVFSEPRQDGITYSVARARQVIIVDDITSHPLFQNSPSSWTGGIVGIPLIIGENVVGVMNMARWSAEGFRPAELRLLGLLADQAALAIMNARLHEAVANQALSDALTGLPNRRALDARLEEDVARSSRYGHQFAVIMMDLDGFKSINDTYGHGTGDQTLRQFAQFMAVTKRASDFLARYGGDELMMILPETDLNAARLVANHIKKRMSEFILLLPDGKNQCLAVSGGIAIYPIHAGSASDLLRAADEALYQAKRKARGTFQVAGTTAAENIQDDSESKN